MAEPGATASVSQSRQLDLFANPTAAAVSQEWQVRVSKRARHLKICVHHDGRVEVVAPVRAKAREIEAFVVEHRDWIAKQQARAKPIDRSLPSQLNLAALATCYRLVAVEADKARPVQIIGDELRIRGPVNQHAMMLQQWLKTTARENLSPWVERLSEQTQLKHERLQWRLQKTRWGSCSSNRTISLNAAIALLSPRQAEYVMLHELCHLKYMSHGPRFWGLLTRHCGEDARALDRQLNDFSLDQLGWLYR